MSRNLVFLGAFGLLTLANAGAACTASSRSRVFGDDSSSGGAGGAGAMSGNGGASSGTGDVGGGFNPTGGSGGGKPGNCSTDPAVDNDGDGFTEQEGDCNDCDANANPGAIEVATMAGGGGAGGAPSPADEDCDGVIDNVPMPCDGAIALDDTDALNGAKAIDLCKEAKGPKDYGVISAAYVRADGSAAAPSRQFGVMNTFGPNVHVQVGSQMLVLSTGGARTPGQPDSCDTHACSGYGQGTAPAGFPQNAPGCDQGTSINDDVGLEVKLRAPKNATGYKYLFKFYSFEFAEYVCTLFNDQYIALVSPPPPGSNNGNISFDSNKNPVSVNIAFFDVCDPVGNSDFALWCSAGCPAMPNPYCPLGPGELPGTGFEDGWGEDAGGTAWLQSTAPINGGDEFTIRYAIWDTEDDIYDSTVLLDGFEWIANGGKVTVGTIDVPDPN